MCLHLIGAKLGLWALLRVEVNLKLDLVQRLIRIWLDHLGIDLCRLLNPEKLALHSGQADFI